MAGRPPGTPAIATVLVTGASASAREQAIASRIEALQPGAASSAAPAGGFSAVILEGMASGASPLHDNPSIRIARIVPGCLCCAGNLVLRVTLNRLLRQGPERLFIGLANGEHLDQLRSWLQQAPYDQLLALGPVVRA